MIESHKFSFDLCPNDNSQMLKVPHASIVGNQTYAQVFMCLDVVYIVGIVGRYFSDLGTGN